jgi:hypothetical protein
MFFKPASACSALVNMENGRLEAQCAWWAKAEPSFELHKRGVKRLKALSRAQKCAAAWPAWPQPALT